jgi:hypothetical protein
MDALIVTAQHISLKGILQINMPRDLCAEPMKPQANSTFCSSKNPGSAKSAAATEDHQLTEHGNRSSPYKPSVQVTVLEY